MQFLSIDSETAIPTARQFRFQKNESYAQQGADESNSLVVQGQLQWVQYIDAAYTLLTGNEPEMIALMPDAICGGLILVRRLGSGMGS